MNDVVIAASTRTALGKSFRGSLNMTRPDDMVAHCLQAVLEKTPQVPVDEIEDIVIGCGYPEGAQGHNVARVAAIRAGLPVTVAVVVAVMWSVYQYTGQRFCRGISIQQKRRRPTWSMTVKRTNSSSS